MSLRRILRFATSALAISWPLLTHWVLTANTPQLAATMLIAVQFALLIWLVHGQLRPRHRMPAVAGLALLSAALIFARHGAGLVLAAAAMHALAYLFLLAVFGASLMPRHEPLVTYFARQIHGPCLSTELQRYTRAVTRAWCVFFILQLLGSALLLSLAPINWWSCFVNVLNAPLVLAMFIVERLTRPLWVANAPHEKLANIVKLVGVIKTRMVLRDQIVSP